ncbi:MAG TPA: NUDIX hydrolase [Chryseolinea sp.]|nr:NUDIX hydrolase [Chryseolinea sp.]HPH46211.1 NUDIX hydrolase [Chryseolinea sp.]HPM31380.1 NUDIX hydrolase [Chryseolinea sp.]
MSRSTLLQQLENYTSSHNEENVFKNQFIELLQHPHAFQRTHLPGHITGSAWIIDDSKSKALLIHHGKLNRWLQPGGHADGDENVLRVALREAEEETGVKNYEILKEGIFDLDIHPIPNRKDFPEHLHYDIRYLVQANTVDELILSDESLNVAWIRLEELPSFTENNSSINRMVEKVKNLL